MGIHPSTHIAVGEAATQSRGHKSGEYASALLAPVFVHLESIVSHVLVHIVWQNILESVYSSPSQ